MRWILWALLWAAGPTTTRSGGTPPQEDVVDHGHVAGLLKHALDAASLFIPPGWKSVFPQALSTVELLQRWNYPSESWQVETSDGHVLMLHRAPQQGRPAVLFLHGMFCASAEWILGGPGRSLALQLYDAGYDVWLGNFRGSAYSQSHRDLTITQRRFWNFSVHEQGVMDLRAMLDEVRSHTGGGPLSVVAHSLGTTALLALLAERPTYNSAVLHAVLLGPVASLRGVRSHFVRVLAHYTPVLAILAELLGTGQVFGFGSLTSRLLSLVCHPGAPTSDVCKMAVFAVAGSSPDLFDAEMLPQILVQYATGISVKSLVHLSDCLITGAFIKPRGEQEKQVEYNLSAIAAPLTLVYANNDLISGPQETMWLSNRTNNISTVFEVPHPTFNHLDFLYGLDATRHLYNTVVSQIEAARRTARALTLATSNPTNASTLAPKPSDEDDVYEETPDDVQAAQNWHG